MSLETGGSSWSGDVKVLPPSERARRTWHTPDIRKEGESRPPGHHERNGATSGLPGAPGSVAQAQDGGARSARARRISSVMALKMVMTGGGGGRVGLYAGFCPDWVGGGHPSRHAVAGGLLRPTRRLGRAALERLRRPGLLRAPALLGLAPGGVYLATPVTRGAGELLPHRFTLTGRVGRRFVFCGTVPRVAPGCR